MKTTLTLFFSLCFILGSFSQYTQEELDKIVQNSSETQLVQENTQLMLLKFYFQSIQIADKLLQLKPDNANYNYRKGYALLYSQSDFTKPLPYLEKAAQSVTKNYDASNNSEASAPIDVYYHIGHCYHLAGDLAKARASFNSYLDVAPKNNELVYYTQVALKQCDVAEKNMAHPNPETSIMNLGKVVNSPYPDYSPAVSLDGTALYFTSRRLWEDSSNFKLRDPMNGNYYEDIYVAFKDFDGDWEEPVRLVICKKDQMEATVSVSADERRIYLYKDSSGNGTIYYSKFQTNRFEGVENYTVKGVNSPYWETHLTVAPDGNSLYFVSDRPGGLGGRDIYRMIKGADGEWSKPENVGAPINTPYDEDAPFIAVDNKTMYYASNGETSMGGFDIFLTVLDKQGKWSDPINLGVPLNSTGDDLFYTTTTDGLTGYLTSFRLGGQGEKDIYEIKNNYMGLKNIAVLKGQITVKDDRPLPEDLYITVNCLNCGETNIRTVFPRMRDGVYFSSLDPCRQYELIYQYGPDRKEFHRQTITTGCNLGYEEIYVPVILDLNDMSIHPADGYKLVGTVLAAKTGEAIQNANVQLVSPTGEALATFTTDDKGGFTSDMYEGKKIGDSTQFSVKITKDGFNEMAQVENIKFGENKTIELNYKMTHPNMLQVNPIYFDLNSSYIRADAKVELDKIVKIMNENPTMKIELGSHTDCRASATYNQWLSDRRAKNSAAYIQAKITNPARIYGKGYGESQLVNGCSCEGAQTSTCSDAEHQANRRTEFKIVE